MKPSLRRSSPHQEPLLRPNPDLTLNLSRALTLTLALALNQEPLLREGSCLREVNAVDSELPTLT